MLEFFTQEKKKKKTMVSREAGGRQTGSLFAFSTLLLFKVENEVIKYGDAMWIWVIKAIYGLVS